MLIIRRLPGGPSAACLEQLQAHPRQLQEHRRLLLMQAGDGRGLLCCQQQSQSVTPGGR